MALTTKQTANQIAEAFHQLVYDSNVWAGHTYWQGVPLQKLPLDLWVYQELIWQIRPELVIECGTWAGGSALYLAQLLDLQGQGDVYTIDVEPPKEGLRPEHPRLNYVQGSSTDPEVVRRIHDVAHDCRSILVILDSDHSRDHVLAELRAYAPLVPPGSYIVVEDTDLNGHPVRPDWGPGPMEAVEVFLDEHPEFEHDHGCEKFLVSFHAGGFLRRTERAAPIDVQLSPVESADETWRTPPLTLELPAPQPVAPLPAELSLGMNVPRTLYLVDRDDNNQGVWRVRWPLMQAAAHGLIADWCGFDAVASINGWIAAGRYNLVVTPRWTFTGDEVHERWAESRKRDGLVWLYETDDDLFSPSCVEREVRVFGVDRDVMEAQRLSRLRMLGDCDGVIVSRKALATVVRRYTGAPVVVVPNAIDVEWFAAALYNRRRIVPPLTIGWSGASRLHEDLEMVAEAWHVIAARYPHVRFVLQGDEHQHDLINAVPRERLTMLPWTTVDAHPATLLNIDIACCAVANTEWNDSKSPNKWFEASLAGSASVVSEVLYGEYVRHGHDGLIASSPGGWVTALGWLIEKEAWRRQLAARARQTVIERHSMAANWWRWPAAWAEILGQTARTPQSNGTQQQHKKGQSNVKRHPIRSG